MSGRRAQWLAALAFVGCAAASAQPAGPTVVHGGARFQQLGRSLLVTTTDGAGTRHSVIDWRSFSVPAGSVTHFLQPGVDSTSINRVTGSRPSEIFGTLSSNGHLVLVNPAGIAVGRGAVIDTAGFTASALALSDGDARAGRLVFEAGKGKGKDKAQVDVRGRILARHGDVVLLGTDVQVDKGAIVQAPNGSVLLAAGQRIAVTGRGLEGIVLELRSREDKVVNLGRLEGDAVGLFASQLRHTGLIRARHVLIVGDKVRLEKGRKGGKPGDTPDGPPEDTPDGPPDDALSGNIDTSSPPSTVGAGAGSGSGPASGPGSAGPADDESAPPMLPVMEAGAAQAVLTASQEVVTVQPPALADLRPGRRRADPALQCIR